MHQHLKEPKRLNRAFQDYLAYQRKRLLLEALFSNSGQAFGAVIYESQALPTPFAERDAQQVAPGAAFPLITFARSVPGMAKPEKWGAEFEVTYEARDRNDTRLLNRNMGQAANTVIRKLNQRAVETLTTAIASVSGATTITSVGGYEDVVLDGSNPTAAKDRPNADLAQLFATVEDLELALT